MKKEKLVGISHWYLALRMVLLLFLTPVVAFIFLIIFTIMSLEDGLIDRYCAIFTILTMLGVFIQEFLYWKFTGIYTNNGGDHLVKKGGYVTVEDKLLNGVIIANQVVRNPIDQLFGMASIKVGIWDDKKLQGVRYKDIEQYDNRMRREDGQFTSMF